MARVQADLVSEALAWLRVIEIGETPTADDASAASELVPGLIADLTTRRVITVDPTAIPDNAFMPLAILLGNRSAPKYGRPRDPDIDMREESHLREVQTTFSRRRGVGAVAM